ISSLNTLATDGSNPSVVSETGSETPEGGAPEGETPEGETPEDGNADNETSGSGSQYNPDSWATQPDENDQATITIDESNNISVYAPKLVEAGTKAFQFTLTLPPSFNADAIFEFHQDIVANTKIHKYVYHPDSENGGGKLNIYIANSSPIFTQDLTDIGYVKTTGTGIHHVTLDANSVKLATEEESNDTVKIELGGKSRLDELTQKAQEDGEGYDSQAPSDDSNGGDNPSESNTPQTVDSSNIRFENEYPTNYVVKIPSFNSFEEGNEFDITAKNVLLAYDKALEIGIKSGNGWQLKDTKNADNDTTIGYTMSYVNLDEDGDVVSEKQILEGDKRTTLLSIDDGSTSGKTRLTVESIEENTMAGSFADTLTFTVAVSSKD
ncbi:MAG: hypothetical protein K2J39_04520, partial [Ruminococcus sp.]|nr:hypothetical protein [Ruminococcus sp.]